MYKSMGARADGPETVNSDITPRKFTVKLIITSGFQHFLT